MDAATYGALQKKIAEVEEQVDGLAAGFDYKGSVAAVADLPGSPAAGDMYTVTGANNARYVYDGTQWINLDAELFDLEDELSDLKSEITQEIVDNLTPSATYTGRSVYVTGGNVFLKEETGYTVQEFSLTAGVQYSVTGSGIVGATGRQDLYGTTATKIPAPTGAFGTGVSVIDSHRLEENVETVSYTPAQNCFIYVSQKDEYTHINVRGNTIVSRFDILTREAAPLSGKKIVTFGDSLFGIHRAESGESMSTSAMIAERTGATVYNAGFGGCKMYKDGTQYWEDFSMQAITASITTNDWTDQDASLSAGSSVLPEYFSDVVTMLKSLDFSKIDIATIGYGTNDFTGNVTEQEFKSALDYSIEELLTAFPNLKIYVISPMFRWWTVSDGSDTHENANNNTLVDFVSYCKAEADKYHVGYIDTYTNLGVNLINRLQYFSSTDGTHPKKAGRYLRAYKISGSLLTE